MVDAEETRRQKAKNLRYKKPVVKGLNLDEINNNLFDIQEECEGIRWYFDGDDDTLINALDGNDDEAYEFKMMFGDLCAECEQMRNDLDEMLWNEEQQEAFNAWFPAISGGDMLGWDPYESDYMPLDGGYEDKLAEKESRKRVSRMTKEQILDTAKLSFRIIRSYLGLMSRYDQLKAAMDILRDQNTGYLQMVKRIEELYEKANEDGFYNWYDSIKEFDHLLECIPQEIWIQ